MNERSFMHTIIKTLLMVLVTGVVFSQTLIETGFLRNSSGQPLSSVYLMKFKIYTQATGGSAIWDSGYLTVSVNEGLYTVHLGEAPQPALDEYVLTNNGNYYFEFEVDSDVFPSRELIAHHARSILADRSLRSDIATSMNAKGLVGTIQADDLSATVSGDLTVNGVVSANFFVGNGTSIRNVSKYKKGTGFFTAGTSTSIISDDFCTNETLVYLNIVTNGTPIGVWQVESSDGTVTIQSDTTEMVAIPFDYVLIKQN